MKSWVHIVTNGYGYESPVLEQLFKGETVIAPKEKTLYPVKSEVKSVSAKALAFFHVAEGKTCYHDSSRERRERMTVFNTAAEKDKLSAWVQLNEVAATLATWRMSAKRRRRH